MLVSDVLKISWLQIYRNKRRYRAAIIGIALGIGGLIGVVTIGDSVESTLGLNLEILGSATIVKAEWELGRATTWHKGQYFDRDVEDLRRLPGAIAVAPAVWQWENVTFGKKKFKAKLYGVGPVFFRAIHLPITKGRTIAEDDVQNRKQVCLIGEKLEEKFVGKNGSALSKLVEFHGLTLEIAGVVGGAADPQYLESLLLPISVARQKVPGMYEIRAIYVRAENWETVPVLHEKVERILKGNQPGYAKSMIVTYEHERIKAITRIVAIFKYFLYMAIVVTLFLGGLGITMIMLAVVVERTQEIGLRKAVGASERMIMSQFLCESLTVSLIGAATGIIAGALAVQVLQAMLTVKANYSVFVLSLLGSVAIGTILGIASGVLPAIKASRQDPVEAMRFE